MPPRKTRNSKDPPKTDSPREARQRARDRLRGIDDHSLASLDTVPTSSKPKRPAKRPQESGEGAGTKPAASTSSKKARVSLSPVAATRLPIRQPDHGPRELYTRFDEFGQKFFKSSWGTVYVPSRADSEPYIGQPVWAELIPTGSTASLAPLSVPAVPIDPEGPHWMTRTHSALPIWHIVTKAPVQRPAAMYETPTRRRQREQRDSASPIRPLPPLPSLSAGRSQPSPPSSNPFLDAPSTQRSDTTSASQPALRSLPADTVMSVPELGDYPTWRDALEAAQHHAGLHGYALSIENSKGKERRTIILRCYKGGKLPEDRKKSAAGAAADAEDEDEDEDDYMALLEGGYDGEDEGEDEGDEEVNGLGKGKAKAKESKPKAKKKRDRGSRMCGCKFRLLIKPHEKDDEIHTLSVLCGEHTGHGPDLDIGIFMGNRLKEKEQDIIWRAKLDNPRSTAIHFIEQLNARRRRLGQPEMTKASIITSFLYRNKAKIAATKEALGVALRQLEMDPERGNLVLRRHTDSEERLDGLFFTHQRMLGLLPYFGEVLAIDATYDVSRYNLKLVQFVVRLSWRSTVTIAFGLIERESSAAYRWLLGHMRNVRHLDPVLFDVIISDNDNALRGAISLIWPAAKTLLCHWHATQNVYKNCCHLVSSTERGEFKAAWRRILQAEHEGDAEKLWQDFKAKYGQGAYGEAAMAYIDRCWRGPDKWPLIAACKTKSTRHFGVRTTSIVESAHSSLKASMADIPARRKYDLLTLIKHCITWQQKRLRDAGTALAEQKKTKLWQRKEALFDDVLGRISHPTLLLVQQELDAARASLKGDSDLAIAQAALRECTADLPRPPPSLKLGIDLSDCPSDECALRSTQVIPCRHRLILLLACDTSVRLSLDDFHPCHHLPDTFACVGPMEMPEPVDNPINQLTTDFGVEVQRELGGDMSSLPVDHQLRIAAAKAAYLNPPSACPADDESYVGVEQGPFEPEQKKPRAAQGHQKHRRLLTGYKRVCVQKSLTTHTRVKAMRCGHCRQPGHNVIQCQASDEEAARLTKEYNEMKKRERAEERQRQKDEREAERQAREDEARRQAAAAGVAYDSDESHENLGYADQGPPDLQNLDEDAEINDRALLCAQRAEALRQAPPPPPMPFPFTPMTPDGSSAATSPASRARSVHNASGDDVGLHSTLVSSVTAAAAVDSAKNENEFLPTLPQLPASATRPSFDAEGHNEDHSTAQQIGEYLGLSGEGCESGHAGVSDSVLVTADAKAPEVSNGVATGSVSAQNGTDAAAEALLALNELVDKPPVPWPALEAGMFANEHIVRQRNTDPLGNCAWWALAWHLGLAGPAAARMEVWLHMQKPWARRALPNHNNEDWNRLLRRIWPGGVYPEDGGASMNGAVDIEYWYSDALDPVVADMTGAPVCCGSRTKEAPWRTSLPVEIEDLSRPPKDPICLLYSPSHYDYFELRRGKPLPPVSLTLWGNKAVEYSKTATHRYLHHHYSFYTWGNQSELDCPCHWTRTAAEMDKPSYKDAPESVSSSEDEAAKSLQVAPSQTTSAAATPSRRSRRQTEKAEEAKKQEEEKKKEEKKQRELKEAQEADLREMRVNSVRTEGLKLSRAQGAQLFPGALNRRAVREEVKRVKKD